MQISYNKDSYIFSFKYIRIDKAVGIYELKDNRQPNKFFRITENSPDNDWTASPYLFSFPSGVVSFLILNSK